MYLSFLDMYTCNNYHVGMHVCTVKIHLENSVCLRIEHVLQ